MSDLPIQLVHPNHGPGVSVTEVGDELHISVEVETEAGTGLPSGGNVGDVLKRTSEDAAGWKPELASVLDAVIVYNNVQGQNYYFDLNAARTFRTMITGGLTTQRFANLPNAGSWVWVVVMDATGGHSLVDLHPVDRWVDGRSYADINTSPNAVNKIVYSYDGTDVSAAMVWNGLVERDPYKLAIADDGVYAVPTDAESIDFGNVTVATGDATVTFKKNGVGNDLVALTAFAEGDWVQVTVAGLTTPTAVRIPRYAT